MPCKSTLTLLPTPLSEFGFWCVKHMSPRSVTRAHTWRVIQGSQLLLWADSSQPHLVPLKVICPALSCLGQELAWHLLLCSPGLGAARNCEGGWPLAWNSACAAEYLAGVAGGLMVERGGGGGGAEDWQVSRWARGSYYPSGLELKTCHPASK